MKKLLTLVLLSAFACSAYAQDKAPAKPAAKSIADAKAANKETGKEPSAKQVAQRERMANCNDRAKNMKGDDRQKFMSNCLKG